MSRKYSILMTAICDGCGRHYLPREQVMEILGVGRTRFYKLPVLRRLNGTVRCDDLKDYLDGHKATLARTQSDTRTAN